MRLLTVGIRIVPCLTCGVSAIAVVALMAWESPPPSAILLQDITAGSGITFRHTDGGSGKRYIVETVTGGLALFDYDGDGDLDVYLLNGAPLRGTKVEIPPRNALYRNEGQFRFADVTAEAGVGDTGYGLAVAVGDYDNDGAPDIYVNNFGRSVMYRNHGDGTFADETDVTGTAAGESKIGGGVCFLDADADGDLDLFVSKYLEFSYDDHFHAVRYGYHVYPGPLHYLPTPHSFYRNNGDGTFQDASQGSGIAEHKGRGMGTICADYDNDGDTDIFVANDSSPNFLFENDGSGRFQEVGTLAGVAYDRHGVTQGSMGVDAADYDHDGLYDFHQTSYQDEWAVLYRNLGGGLFEDVTLTTGAGLGTRQHVKWGNAFVDFDNDGDKDLFIACGHLYDNVDQFCGTTTYKVRNVLLANNGRGKFLDVSQHSGDGLLPRFSSRGAAFDDLDGDGDIDGVILNSRDLCTVLRNDSPGKSHWLQVRLVGRSTNRDGVGAHVRIVAGDLTQIAEVHSGRGYQSHFGTRLHFGLGTRQPVDRVEVHWLGGGVDVLYGVLVDNMLTIQEGSAKITP